MPAVVADYAERQDFGAVRSFQDQILADYSRDFAKHMPVRLVAYPARMGLDSQASFEGEQEARVRPSAEGARASDFEGSLDWLDVWRISQGEASHEAASAFRIL